MLPQPDLAFHLASKRGGQMDRGHHSTPTPANYAPTSSEIHFTLQSGAVGCVQGCLKGLLMLFECSVLGLTLNMTKDNEILHAT